MTWIGTGRGAEQAATFGGASLMGYTPIHSCFFLVLTWIYNVNKNENLYDRNCSLFSKADISVRTNAEYNHNFEDNVRPKTGKGGLKGSRITSGILLILPSGGTKQVKPNVPQHNSALSNWENRHQIPYWPQLVLERI